MRSYPVTQGYGVGSNLRVLPWERDLVKGILSGRLSALSVARGAGKSAIIAAIGAAFFEHLVETGQRADVVCIASSFGQGKIIFDHSFSYLADKLADRRAYRIRDTNTKFILPTPPNRSEFLSASLAIRSGRTASPRFYSYAMNRRNGSIPELARCGQR